MKSLSLKEIISAVGGIFKGNLNTSETFIGHITTDTRKIQEGDLFIPLKGDNFDGHDFLLQAFEKGASCCFSETEAPFSNLILVKDTKKALKDLAKYYRSLFSIPVVAITGSVGKTTTKDLIASVLSQKYSVLKTEGNFNNEIGLPLTIFCLEEFHEVAVLEMGMNSFGEIHNLSEIAEPDIAVITNIGVSHIENLGSRNGILKAKCEIFDFMNEKGIAVLNADDDKLITLDNKLKNKINWYGIYNKSGIYADEIQSKGLEGIFCRIHTQLGEFCTDIPVSGEHMIYNAMSATIVGILLELNLEEIKKGIEQFTPSKMRMNILNTNAGIKIINDSYNANPVSMKAAIDVLKNAQKRTVCILGDMLELGEYTKIMHYEVGSYAAQKKIDCIICIGTFAKYIAEGAIKEKDSNVFFYADKEEFFERGLQILKADDVVLVKASRGMHFEKIVEKIQEVK